MKLDLLMQMQLRLPRASPVRSMKPASSIFMLLLPRTPAPLQMRRISVCSVVVSVLRQRELPATVAAEGSSVRAGPAATTVTTATTTPTAPAASAATTTAEACHLGEARVDLLLRLGEHLHEVPSLLLVCRGN